MSREKPTTGTIIRIANRAQGTTNTEVTTSMDIRLVETRYILDRVGERGVIRLRFNEIDQCLPREVVHDLWREVSLQTPRYINVNLERGLDKRSVLHAATTRATHAGYVERVLGFCGGDEGAVAAEAVRGGEDVCFKDCGGGVVRAGGIERPVPVGLGAGVVTYVPEGLLIFGDEVAVPEDEVTLCDSPVSHGTTTDIKYGWRDLQPSGWQVSGHDGRHGSRRSG